MRRKMSHTLLTFLVALLLSPVSVFAGNLQAGINGCVDCVNNECVYVEGSGAWRCSSDGNSCGTAASCTSSSCFLAGTMISTPFGSVPIERIRVGDLVNSVDAEGVPVTGKVTELVFSVEPTYLILNRKIRVTPSHRFMVPVVSGSNATIASSSGIGPELPVEEAHELGVWREANYLTVGDELLQENGLRMRLERIEVAHPLCQHL